MLSHVRMLFCDTFPLNVPFFQWMDTASLPSLIYSSSKWPMNRRNPSLIFDGDYSTPEPILSRRRPLLSSSMDRQRRSADEDSTTDVSEVTSENTTGIDEQVMNSTDLGTTLIEPTTTDNETLLTTLPPGNETSAQPVSGEQDTAILLFNYTTVAQSTMDDTQLWINSTIALESSTDKVEPICDRACQCTEECPYGFDIVEDKCQCDPPCKVDPL